jgi:MFS superfamily sulfate permease-like transporter
MNNTMNLSSIWKRILSSFKAQKGYDTRSLKQDLFAGVTVALVLIPQSMAYAELAGLPSYYGLYASFLPPLVASVFGCSRQLATGPVAVVSLLTASTLEPIATAGSQQYLMYAVSLALMVGIFQFALGVLRLGVVVNFISHPAVNGFTNAAALIIATSQLPKLLGIHVDKASHHYETVWHVIQSAVHYTHWPSLAMGAAAFAIMFVLHRVAPRTPHVLVAVIITTTISWMLGFEHNTTITVSQIQGNEIKSLIEAFNSTVDRSNRLMEKRAQLAKNTSKYGGVNMTLAQLEEKQELERLSFQIQQLKSKGKKIRATLRHHLFHAGPGSDGARMFYPLSDAQDRSNGAGGTWRLSVGSDTLDPNRLKMIGNGQVVGKIPPGLPSLSFSGIDLSVMASFLPSVAIISLLGFMEAISVAKAIAAKTGQRLDPNRELIGQGLANIVGSVSNSYPVSGSFSRSAVSLQSGAVSSLPGVVTSLTVTLVLVFLTPLFYHLPQAVLAAIIMFAVVGLLNVHGFIHAWKAQWYDGVISIITFVSTLVFAPHLDKGILIGVGLSIMLFLYKSMRPNVVDLSMDVDHSLRDAIAGGLKECRFIDVVRFDGPLFFANASYLEEQIRNRRMEKKELKHIIISAYSISDMDASGEEALSLIVDRVRSAGIDISLSGVHRPVMNVLKRTQLYYKVGEDHFYATVDAAVSAIHASTHFGENETDCPLKTVCLVSHQRVEREN